jgi:pimeloyl-ACP methyl ester carboxylesterase
MGVRFRSYTIPTVEGRIVNSNGIDLFTESFGSESDPAVLLIMGACASGVWWPQEFCRRLAARGRYVIRYDHRDTGRSTTYSPGEIHYTVEDLADDAVAVLDGLRAEQAHLAGMSLGGFLAQLIALKHPGRVRTLTLIASEPLGPGDPAIPPIDPRITAWHAQAASLDWSDKAAIIEYGVGAWRLLSGSAHAFDEAGIRAMATEDLERGTDLRTSMNHALLTGGEQWYNRLNEITAPTLIIHGTEDPVLRYAHALALEKGIPRAQLVTLDGTGHELHPSDWDTILDALIAHTKG